MRSWILSVLLLLSFIPVSMAAFNTKVEVMAKEEIGKLSDDVLLDTYMDVLVELEAIRSFHSTSGFSPKQYDEYRDLLKYRLQILMEIHTRNMELPAQMERF